MNIKIKIEGDTKLSDKLNHASDDAKKEIKNALLLSALAIERDAKINCPVDTGLLRNSITHKVEEDSDKITATTGTNTEYAPYVEYGTSKMPAQPYLRPAYEKNKDAITRMIKQAILKALK